MGILTTEPEIVKPAPEDHSGPYIRFEHVSKAFGEQCAELVSSSIISKRFITVGRSVLLQIVAAGAAPCAIFTYLYIP